MSNKPEGAEGPPASGLQRYPAVDQTDAVQGERRSFSSPAEAPKPSDACPASTTDGRLGPGGDPAEGKRED